MRLFTFGSAEIKCSPLLILIIPFAIIFNAVGEALTALLSLSVHECCHTLVAKGLGYRISSVEIQPFGFVAKMHSAIYSSGDELAIALTGPVCSLVIAAAATAISVRGGSSSEWVLPFARFNLVLGFVNLLPALPLDGGRAVKSLLSLCIRPQAAIFLCALSGIIFGMLLMAFGILSVVLQEWNLSSLLMGVFLILAAIKELRMRKNVQLNALVQRSFCVKTGEGLRTLQTAVDASSTLGEVLRLCASNRYNVFLVLDESMSVIGRVDEGSLLRGIAEYGGTCRLTKLIKRVH